MVQRMKISIIGTGRTGTAIAFALVSRRLADELVLVSRDPDGVAAGHAMDLQHAGVFLNTRAPGDVRSGSIGDSAGSDIVIVTSSVPPPKLPPGVKMDRGFLAEGNYKLFKDLIPQLADASPGAVFVIVTNPVDVMTWAAVDCCGLPARQVMGTGTLIDTGRFRALLRDRVDGHPNDVRAYVLGEHGSTMVAGVSVATIAGMKLPLTQEEVRDRFDGARESGHVVFRKKGYTDYAIAGCTSMIVRAVAEDTREVLPVSVRVDGPFGLDGVCLSLPCVIGRGGVMRILEPDLDAEERDQLKQSAAAIRSQYERVKNG